MRIAARWFGWCSLVLAAAATLAALRVRQPEPTRASIGDSFWELAISDHDDEVAVQSCFDLHSGLVSVERDEDQRAVTVRVEADGALARCLARYVRPTRLFSPPGVYVHEAHDPWAPRIEAALFPPKTYRCTETPEHVISHAQRRMVDDLAAPCLGESDAEWVDARLGLDGRILDMEMVNVRDPQRAECLRRAICQFQFDSMTAVPDVPIMVMGPLAREKLAPALKNPDHL